MNDGDVVSDSVALCLPWLASLNCFRKVVYIDDLMAFAGRMTSVLLMQRAKPEEYLKGLAYAHNSLAAIGKESLG